MVSDVPFDELLQVSGAHDDRGILLAKGPHLARGKTVYDAKLIDMTPTILHAMELPVPSEMDGQVLTEIFADGDRVVESVELDLLKKTADSHLSEDEEQLIKDKLKGWGYL
jgi:arylsulfatase A-like enzyme